MELRFLKENWEYGKFRLQYRKEICSANGIPVFSEWRNVPSVEQELDINKPSGAHHPYCDATYREYKKDSQVRICQWTCCCRIMEEYDAWRENEHKFAK